MVTRAPVLLVAITGAVLAASTPGHAGSALEGSTTRIRIEGVVPTICRAQFTAGAAQPDQSVVDLGVLTELCNNLGGYRVVLRHASDLTGGTVTVDGETKSLSSTGFTVITDAAGPAAVAKSVSIDFGSNAPGSIGVMIQPKGAVF